jgi:hypothetical protein
VIFLGALGSVELVENCLHLVIADAHLDLVVLEPVPGDLTLDLSAERCGR